MRPFSCIRKVPATDLLCFTKKNCRNINKDGFFQHVYSVKAANKAEYLCKAYKYTGAVQV